VRSRNLENEEAKARNWAVKDTTQWVVTPGKQTNNHINEVKLKVTLEQAMKAQKGRRGIALLFL
jgi:hypothetical protein